MVSNPYEIFDWHDKMQYHQGVASYNFEQEEQLNQLSNHRITFSNPEIIQN